MEMMSEEEFRIQLSYYNDRGMKKWGGFFLSEHTQAIEQLEAKERNVNTAKILMETDEISLVLHEAISKNKMVAIQLLETDLDGSYPDDIIGLVQGYDIKGVYVDGAPILLENIRNIEIEEYLKWTQLDNMN